MGPEFITRSIRSSAIVLLIFVPFGIFYMGFYPALAVFSGGVWGLLNLFFITRLVRVTLRPEGTMLIPALGLALFKFPLMFIAGYGLLKIENFDPMFLVIGFSGILGILILRVLGYSITASNKLPEDSKVSNVA